MLVEGFTKEREGVRGGGFVRSDKEGKRKRKGLRG